MQPAYSQIDKRESVTDAPKQPGELRHGNVLPNSAFIYTFHLLHTPFQPHTIARAVQLLPYPFFVFFLGAQEGGFFCLQIDLVVLPGVSTVC